MIRTLLRSLLLAMLGGAGFTASVRPATAQTIVAFGDSTTAPRGAIEVYAALLQKELSFEGKDVRVINAGVPGNTTAMAKARFEKDVLDQKPDVAIIQFGINDSAVDVWKKPPATKPRVAMGDYEKNLWGFVTALKERGTRVLLMTPNPLAWTDTLRKLYSSAPYKPEEAEGMNVLLFPYAATAKLVAREQGVALLDVYAAFEHEATRPDFALVKQLLPDGMHPNDKGHRLVADLITDHLTKVDPRFARKPFTVWKRSGDDMLVNPLATDISHDTPAETVLGPALAKLPDGAVMSVYSTPTSYGGKPGGCYIAGRITRDGGKTWEPERELARNLDCRSSHPTALTARDGTLHIFYLGYVRHSWKDGNPTADEHSDLWTVRSSDGGKTWTAPQMMIACYTGATNGACETRDGHLIVPFSYYVSNPGRLNARAVVSSDGGKTWTPSNSLDIGGAGDHEGALEPAVIELKDGRIWMLIRTSRKFFWQSFSSDGGLTFSAPTPTTISSSHAPGHLTRLADGRIALVWNPAADQRRKVHLALSDDDGKTWSPSVVVAKGSSVAYPFVFEPTPGDLWIGIMDVHGKGGWGVCPRARHVKIPEQVVLDNARSAAVPAVQNN